KVLNDAVAHDIELCAQRSGKAARPCEVAVNAVKRDGGNCQRDSREIGCKGVAEEREQRHRCKRRADAHHGYLVRSHVALPFKSFYEPATAKGESLRRSRFQRRARESGKADGVPLFTSPHLGQPPAMQSLARTLP